MGRPVSAPGSEQALPSTWRVILAEVAACDTSGGASRRHRSRRVATRHKRHAGSRPGAGDSRIDPDRQHSHRPPATAGRRALRGSSSGRGPGKGSGPRHRNLSPSDLVAPGRGEHSVLLVDGAASRRRTQDEPFPVLRADDPQPPSDRRGPARRRVGDLAHREHGPGTLLPIHVLGTGAYYGDLPPYVFSPETPSSASPRWPYPRSFGRGSACLRISKESSDGGQTAGSMASRSRSAKCAPSGAS